MALDTGFQTSSPLFSQDSCRLFWGLKPLRAGQPESRVRIAVCRPFVIILWDLVSSFRKCQITPSEIRETKGETVQTQDRDLRRDLTTEPEKENPLRKVKPQHRKLTLIVHCSCSPGESSFNSQLCKFCISFYYGRWIESMVS